MAVGGVPLTVGELSGVGVAVGVINIATNVHVGALVRVGRSVLVGTAVRVSVGVVIGVFV